IAGRLPNRERGHREEWRDQGTLGSDRIAKAGPVADCVRTGGIELGLADTEQDVLAERPRRPRLCRKVVERVVGLDALGHNGGGAVLGHAASLVRTGAWAFRGSASAMIAPTHAFIFATETALPICLIFSVLVPAN